MNDLVDEEKVLQDDVYNLYDFTYYIIMGFFDKGKSFEKALELLNAKTHYEYWVSPQTLYMISNE